MKPITMFLIVSMPIIIFLIIVFSLYKIIKRDREMNVVKKGVNIFQLDLHSRKIKNISPLKNKAHLKWVKRSEKGWFPFSIILKEFDIKEKNVTLINQALHEIEINNVYKKIKINESPKIINNKRNKFLYTFYFYPNEINSDYTVIIKWRLFVGFKKSENSQYIVKKQNYNKKYSGFIAFNKSSKDEQLTVFIRNEILNTMKIKGEIIRYENMIIFYIRASSHKKIIKLINKIKQTIEQKNIKILIKSLYDSVVIYTNDSIDNPQKIKTCIKVLTYLMYKSSIEKKELIITSVVNMNSVKVFFKEYANYQQKIKLRDITTCKLKVIDKDSKEEILNYGIPIIQGVNNSFLQKLFLNPYEKNKLINAHVDMINKENIFDIAIDLNINYLNNMNFTNKNVVYILDSLQIKNIKIYSHKVKLLIEEGYVFALKVSSFNSWIGVLINQIKPSFIIISSNAWKRFNVNKEELENEFISLKNISIKYKIKIIFENPGDYPNNYIHSKIGYKYYYSFSKKQLF